MDEQHSPPKSELKFLERLSIEELETLLKFSGDPDDVELLFDTVVEEVVAREENDPTGRLPNVDAAWDELQMMYNSMDRGTVSTHLEEVLPNSAHGAEMPAAQEKDKPKRFSFRKVVRTAAVMATAIALCLGLMVVAQAAGADVFGVLARWTDDTFHFETRSAELTYCETLHDTIQEVFDTQGISGEFVPTWYPEGYEIAEIRTSEDALGISIEITLSSLQGYAFFIRLDQYNQNNYIEPLTFEIESGSVEEYLSNGKTYFIFTNAEVTTTAYSDNTTLYRIWGELNIYEMKCILDSVGG